MRGVIIGKFYPLHKGHQFLIETGIENSDLTIIVAGTEGERPAAPLRVSWIRKLYPEADVRLLKMDPDWPEYDSQFWAEKTVEFLGWRPDVVFTSEGYGDPWALYLGCEHHAVDPTRAKVPISGTMIRENPLDHLEFLDPIVRAYYVKRVVVVGAESTGTTTLTKALASKYETVWIPEYGRLFTEATKVQGAEVWHPEEFVHIAVTQNQMENDAAKEANKVLFCDTDSLATALWYERYFPGEWNGEVERLSIDRKQPDLYILTSPVGVPFEQDGYREGGRPRLDMHVRFIEYLRERDLPFILVSGSVEERVEQASKEINKLLAGQESHCKITCPA